MLRQNILLRTADIAYWREKFRILSLAPLTSLGNSSARIFSISHKNRNVTNRKYGGILLSLEENKAMIHRFIKALNNQNLGLLDELMASDYVEHTLELEGLESWKQYVTKFLKGFPDLKVTIEDIIAEGDKVWTCVKIAGTHTGEWRGITPTGKMITQKCVWIDRIADGKFVESWSVDDNLDLLKQLGIIEYKGFPEE